MDLFKAIEDVIHDLERYHDVYTESHECRTGKLMFILGEALGFDKAFCTSLERAGSIHDIGKLAIPEKILEKPGPLSAFEREVVQLHAEIGYKLTKKLKHPLAELASNITLTHHEAYDGSGYPYGLKGKNIPLEGQICSICDVYDALVSRRPYREARSHEMVIQMLQDSDPNGMANKFAPKLLDAFIGIHDQIIQSYITSPTG